MTDRNAQLTENVNGGDVAWLEEASKNDTSLDHLKVYHRVQTLRIVQGSSKREVKDLIGDEGNCYLNPGLIPILPRETWLKVVPLLTLTQFRKMADFDDKDAERAIVESSWEPTSDLAIQCRDFNRNKETYGDEGQFTYRFLEVLIYFMTPYSEDHPQRGLVFATEFQSTSFKYGKKFASSVCSRMFAGRPVPLWAQVHEIATKEGPAGTSTAWAIHNRNPEGGDSLNIRQEEAEDFKQIHEFLRDKHNADALTTEGNDDHAEAGKMSAEEQARADDATGM